MLCLFLIVLLYSFTHKTLFMSYSLLDLSETARDYFDATKPENAVNGYERFILTDGVRCLVVTRSHHGGANEVVFRCYIQNEKTFVEVAD